MTHDEFLKLVAAESLTPDQKELLREHASACADCTAEAEPQAGRRWFEHWWLAVAAVLFLALWIWREAGIRVARERADSDRAEAVQLQNENDVLRQQRGKLLDEMLFISSPQVRVIPLKGAEGAAGSFFLDPAAHRAVIVATALPPAGAEGTYEVWLTSAVLPHPQRAATFDGHGGQAAVLISDVPVDARSVLVTLEKNSGATVPAGRVVLSGELLTTQ